MFSAPNHLVYIKCTAKGKNLRILYCFLIRDANSVRISFWSHLIFRPFPLPVSMGFLIVPALRLFRFPGRFGFFPVIVFTLQTKEIEKGEAHQTNSHASIEQIRELYFLH